MSGRWLSTRRSVRPHVCDLPEPVVADRVGAAWQCECGIIWRAVGGYPAEVCSWVVEHDRKERRRLLREARCRERAEVEANRALLVKGAVFGRGAVPTVPPPPKAVPRGGSGTSKATTRP